jgi:hypothetical protein
VRLTWLSRALAAVGPVLTLVLTLVLVLAALGAVGGTAGALAAAAPAEQTVCFDGSLARTRTEVDADVTVPQFDGSLGALLDVTVAGPSVHLDTDAVFESIAGSAVTFAEHMDYLLTLTSPGGIASPPPISGTIERVPSQMLAAFDGTLDFLGASAVTQPSTTRDETATGVTSADAPVLTAFTGAGTVPFHLTTSISETFMGGGGNVQAQINTFVSADVRVCYRYAPPPPEIVPEGTPEPPAAPPVGAPHLPATGSTSAPLAGIGAVSVVIGAALAWRWRAPKPHLDG